MSPSSVDIMRLHLEGNAELAAMEFAREHRSAKIISGKRTITEQAEAMAYNIVRHSKREEWLDIYLYRPIRNACKKWVKANPKATEAQVADGIAGVLRTFTEVELHKLSVHFSGKAFDVQPVGGIDGMRQLETLRKLVKKYDGKLLTKEGGLVRWHVQFP